ncbi:hypothetical protein D3C80_1483670 [compost metagenome]
MRCPHHLLVAIHQTGQRQVPCIAHQLGGLLAGAAAGDAFGYAEQRMGLAFALVEIGYAWGGFGFVGHRLGTISLCATRQFPHIGVTAAHGVEIQAYGKPGRRKPPAYSCHDNKHHMYCQVSTPDR